MIKFLPMIVQVLPLSIAGAGVTVIELYALHRGIDGIALGITTTTLGAIAGFIFKTIIKKKEI